MLKVDRKFLMAALRQIIKLFDLKLKLTLVLNAFTYKTIIIFNLQPYPTLP